MTDQQNDTDDETVTVDDVNEDLQQEAQDADAGLTAGYDRIKKGESTAPVAAETADDIMPDLEQAEPEPEKTETVKEAAPEPEWLKDMEKFNNRLRGIEGKIGGLMDKLDKPAAAKATEGDPDTTVEDRIDSTLENLEAVEGVAENFEDFAPIVDALKALKSDVANISQKTGKEGSTKTEESQQAVNQTPTSEAAIEQAREQGYLDARHEGWQKTASSEEFYDFSLKDGPQPSRYQEYLDFSAAADGGTAGAREQAVKVREGIRMDHPKWWENKGQYLFSDRASDVSTLLDKYKVIEKNKAKRSQQANRNQNRLAAASEPDASSGKPANSAGLSDSEALNAGYKKVAGNRLS